MTNADFTLINLNMLYVKYMDGIILRQNHLPLGPLHLISALEEKNIIVDFRDYQLIESERIFDYEVFIEFINNPARIIGISCMANLLPFALFCSVFIKKKYPDSVLIIGGVGSAEIEYQIMEQFQDIDIIHYGEGEKSAPMLIKCLIENESLENVPSIFYRNNGSIVINSKAKRIKNLDKLPRPAYHHVNFEQYQGYNIMSSRGCPYQCTFCSITPVWGGKSYSFSADRIVDEMKFLHDQYNVKEFLFQDEYFISSSEQTIEFCKKIIKKGLEIKFKAFARVDLVTKESLKALNNAGCIELRFGIESGSDKVLQLIRKGFSSEIVMNTIELAKKYIPGVDAFYVWGFPFETIADFRETLLQMISLRCMGVRCLPSLITYLPQTELYKSLKDKSDLEFSHFIFPEYMVSGIEERQSVRVNIRKENRELFNFIKNHKDLFPGFFHYDLKNNIEPKLELLEEFGFYTREDETCGAHSPSKINKSKSFTH